MASTYSALKIELIATGEQSGTWGATTNVNLGDAALGEAITGSADVAFSSADVTITLTDTNTTQAARNLRLNLTGTSGGARNLILGSGCQIEKLYLVNNGLADAVTVKNTTGTGIAIPAGKSAFVYNNGTNVVEAVNYAASISTGAITCTSLTDSGLTSGRVTYAGTAGLLQDSANLLFNGTTLTANTIGAYTLSGTIAGGGNQINNVIIGTTTPLAGSFTTLSSSGVATFSAGTVSLPAITTTGDTNTGIYFPAADTIAFTEGGAEAMRIDSSGSLIVGGNTNAGNARLLSENTSGNQLGLRYSGIATWYNSIDSSGNYIWNKDGTEYVRISSSGLVGIGTSSPSWPLDVQKSSDGIVGYFRRIGATVNPALYITANETGNTVGFGTDYAGATSPAMTFTTGGTERMRITSAGDVAIGATSVTVPSGGGRLLQVGVAGTQYHVLVAGNTGGNNAVNNVYLGQGINTGEAGMSLNTFGSVANGAYTLLDNSAVSGWSVMCAGSPANGIDYFKISRAPPTAGVPAFVGLLTVASNGVLTSAGNVLAPSFRTNASTAIDTAGVFGQNSTYGTYIFSNPGSSRIFSLYNGSGGEQYTINTDYSHVWYTNTAERMRIDSSGLVGIGTSSITAKLEVKFDTTVSASNGAIGIENAGYGEQGITFTKKGLSFNGPAAAITYNGSNIGVTSAGYLSFRTNAGTDSFPTERMRINSSGNVGIGTTSPESRLHVLDSTNGGTIQLGSTTVDAGTSTINLYGQQNYINFRHRNVGTTTSQIFGGPAAFGTDSSGYLTFSTSTTGGSLTERARIDSSGNLLVGTTTTASAVSNTKYVVGGTVYSFRGELSTMTSGVAYTMFTMTADYATYIVTVGGLVASVVYSETAIVMISNTSVSTTVIADGALVTISNSGLAVQFTQSSGTTMGSMIWSAIRIL